MSVSVGSNWLGVGAADTFSLTVIRLRRRSIREAGGHVEQRRRALPEPHGIFSDTDLSFGADEGRKQLSELRVVRRWAILLSQLTTVAVWLVDGRPAQRDKRAPTPKARIEQRGREPLRYLDVAAGFHADRGAVHPGQDAPEDGAVRGRAVLRCSSLRVSVDDIVPQVKRGECRRERVGGVVKADGEVRPPVRGIDAPPTDDPRVVDGERLEAARGRRIVRLAA